MKKYLLFVLLFGFFANAQTPITFSINDLPLAGANARQRIAFDTLPLPAVNFGNAGANQVYDFSNLSFWKNDTIEYRVPTAAQLTVCPNADVATTLDGINYLFTNTDNAANKLILEGIEGELYPGSIISAAYSTKPELYHFPTVYQTKFGGTAALQKTIPGSQVGQPVDAVRVTLNTTYTDTVDGWGKVITPVGAYKCLRKKRIETTTTLIEYRVFSFSSFTTYSSSTKTTTRYSYIAKEAKGSVVNFNYDTADVLQSVNWSLNPPAPPVPDFTWNNVSGGLVTFTDQTDGYPDSRSWTFGDGGVSTQQSPNHTYAVNNNYNVCLTVTNAGGSNQVCKNVTVTKVSAGNHPPLATDNFYTIMEGSDTIVHVALDDSDPDGDNLCVSDVWGSAHGLTSLSGVCGGVYYQSLPPFSGFDTCYYKVCDDGIPSLCDTGRIIFSVIALNRPPVAVNDTASVLQPGALTVDVGANDSDPDGHTTFCVTNVWGAPAFSIANTGNCTEIAFVPDSTFTGKDTCYYVICDNGTPTYCDTATLIVTVQPNPDLLPQVSFVFNTLPCRGIVAINTSTQADNVVWSFHQLAGYDTWNDVTFVQQDTVRYAQYSDESQFQFCLTATNPFGQATICDTATTTCIVGIADELMDVTRFFPNPADKTLYFVPAGNEANTTLSLYNPMGQKIKTFVLHSAATPIMLSVEDVVEGIYLLVANDKGGSSKLVGKVVIQH